MSQDIPFGQRQDYYQQHRNVQDVYAPFAQPYLQTQYNQNIQLNQPTAIPIQKSGQVLDQLQFKYDRTQPQVEQSKMLHQHHQITHPQARDYVHREAPITVVTREEIESVWRNKCQHLEQALTEVQMEVMRLRGIGMSEKVTYVEDTLKLNQLYLEIDRLNKCLLDMSLELENYKHKLHMATDKNARNVQEVEVDKMRAIMLENEAIMSSEINRLRSQLEEWQKRYRILELSLSEARGGESTVREMEAQMSQLRQETDRLNFQLNSQRAETEDWKLKYQRLESQLREQSTSEIEIRRLKEMVDNRNREIESLRANVQSDQEGRLQQGRLEIDRLNRELRAKSEEYAKLRQQMSALELKAADTSQYQNANQQLQNLQSELERTQGDLRSLQSRFNDQVNEIQRNKAQQQQLQVENEDWRDRFTELRGQYDDLEYQMQQSSQTEEITTKLQTDVEIWQRKFRELNKEYHKIQEDLMLTTAELDSLKNKRTETVVVRSSVNQSSVASSGLKKSQDQYNY